MWDIKVDRSFKLILLGDTGVGKTSLVNRRCYQDFDDRTPMTVAATSVSTIVDVGVLKIELKIWDTAGQEQYASLIPMFCRNTDVCLLIADAARLETVDGVRKWEALLDDVGCRPPKVLVLNKCDLRPDLDPATEPKLQNLAGWYPRQLLVSAKSGENVNEMFAMAAELALQFARPHLKADAGYGPAEMKEQKTGLLPCC
jgi:small GTP-binding protein